MHRRLLPRWGAQVISWIARAVAAWEGLGFLVCLVLGLGVGAYIAAVWTLHFARQGTYSWAAAVAVLAVIVAFFAMLRVPLALVFVWASAAVAGVALLTGTVDVLLP
jgi:hypothetical protein